PGLAPVRRAERVAEARDPADVVAARARAHRDRFGTALGADLEHLLADLVERLVPGDALPLAGTARADSALRVFQAIGVIDELRSRGANLREVAVIQRAFGVALDLRELAVVHVHQRSAATVAAPADALQNLVVSRHLCRGSRPCLYCAHFVPPARKTCSRH